VAKNIYCWSIADFLFLSGLAHLAVPQLTERWLSRTPIIRVIGVILMMLSIPCLFWRGWYFWTLGVALALSGLWRACFPENSVRAQQKSYPRWVHGCLLIGGAILVWVLEP
jgi:uncharacterized membrane protein YdbT with pleckstrin-like domain